MEKYIFPVENIKKKDGVIVYGAGKIGQAYVRQIMAYDLCQLLCVVDEKALSLTSACTSVKLPSALVEYKFDYVLIAVKNPEKAIDIQAKLQDKYAVPAKKIIWSIKSVNGEDDNPVIALKPPLHPDNDKITIAVSMTGGIGDAIIAKKFICELAAQADYDCQIDIYTEKHIVDFVTVLYQDVSWTMNVYSCQEQNIIVDTCAYDLVIRPGYVFAILHRNDNALRKKHYSFAILVEKMVNYLHNEGLLWSHPVDNGVQFARAKRRGENAYTIYSFGGLLPIKDRRVSIPLLSEKGKEYMAFFKRKKISSPFITINYGGSMKAENNFSKIWPLEYFCRLTVMIKNKYPNLKIVQLGRKDTPPIDRADLFLAGMDIEFIKYVLRDSLLHIDSESGLVHIASQLETPCLVAFGPTPIHFFGYPHNINVTAGNCHDCCYLDNDFTKCIRGMKRAECMHALTPDILFDKFVEQFTKFFDDRGRG